MSTKEALLAPMRPKLREFKITDSQWRVMRVINDRGCTDATGLAEVGLLHAPSVTRILKELDGRRSLVGLFPDGRTIVKAVSRHVLHLMREYSDRFGPQRLEELVEELRALTAAIKKRDVGRVFPASSGSGPGILCR